jgi:hypothetical protein
MGYVYIYECGENLYKIGKAVDLDKRIKALSTGNPYPLTEVDVIETDQMSKCETFLHHRLRSKRSGRSRATEIFEVDRVELTALIAEARKYLDDTLPKVAEAERLAAEESEDNVVLEPTEAHLATYRRLVEVREAYESLALEKERLEAEIKIAMGSAGAMEGVATWKTVVARKFDQEAFSDAHPELYAAYQRDTRSRRFLY